MSYNDAMAKLKWYQKCAMESPLESPERMTWVEILRELEAFIRRMTTAATVVNSEQM